MSGGPIPEAVYIEVADVDNFPTPIVLAAYWYYFSPTLLFWPVFHLGWRRSAVRARARSTLPSPLPMLLVWSGPWLAEPLQRLTA